MTGITLYLHSMERPILKIPHLSMGSIRLVINVIFFSTKDYDQCLRNAYALRVSHAKQTPNDLQTFYTVIKISL